MKREEIAEKRLESATERLKEEDRLRYESEIRACHAVAKICFILTGTALAISGIVYLILKITGR